MPASEILERIDRLVSEIAEHAPEPFHEQLLVLAKRLREPARVAVVGRVKAGKSTLVNALLGQRVAPTDVSECTRLVTWYRYGQPQRVVLNLRDGTSCETMLSVDGMLPSELPVVPELVSSIDVFLANDALRGMTLIDTPGIGSVNPEFSAATEEFLAESKASAKATAVADAVIFMLNTVVMQDELDVLKALRGERDGSAVNAIGVLGRADQLGDGTRDPWLVALELADRFAGTLRNDVAAVVPVVGIIAECCEAALLTERDARALAQLAAMDPKSFAKLAWSADRFTTAEAPVDEQVRVRLLGLLDLYGINRAVAALRDGTTGAVGLRRNLSGVSGIAEVKRTLGAYFRDQDHVLKARSALEQLRKMGFADGPDGRTAVPGLLAKVEELQLDPLLHPLLELETLHDLCTGRVALPDELDDELRRLLAPSSAAVRLGAETDDPVVLRTRAADMLGAWREFLVTEASPPQARVARVALRSLQLLWEKVGP